MHNEKGKKKRKKMVGTRDESKSILGQFGAVKTVFY